MWHTFAETVVFTLPCCGCSCLARLLGARAFYMTFFPWLTVSILTLHRNAFHMYTLGSCINPSVYTKIYSCKNIIGTGRDTWRSLRWWPRWLPTGLPDTSIEAWGRGRGWQGKGRMYSENKKQFSHQRNRVFSYLKVARKGFYLCNYERHATHSEYMHKRYAQQHWWTSQSFAGRLPSVCRVSWVRRI